MGKKSVKKAANTKAQKLAVGTLPPAGWNELFCRESDVPSLNAAIVLLKATYPQQPTASAGRYDNLNLKKLMRMMVPRPNGDGDDCVVQCSFVRIKMRRYSFSWRLLASTKRSILYDRLLTNRRAEHLLPRHQGHRGIRTTSYTHYSNRNHQQEPVTR